MSETSVTLLNRLLPRFSAVAEEPCIAAGERETADLIRRLEAPAAAALAEAMPSWLRGAVAGELKPDENLALMKSMDEPAMADWLRACPGPIRLELLNLLKEETRNIVRTLLDSGSHQVGSKVDTQVLTVRAGVRAGEALNLIKAQPAKVRDYLFVLDGQGRLVGVASLKSLLLAEDNPPVENLAQRDPNSLLAATPLTEAARHPWWRRSVVMPVVDPKGVFMGVLDRDSLPKEEDSGGDGMDAASQALGESFAVGFHGLVSLIAEIFRSRR